VALRPEDVFVSRAGAFPSEWISLDGRLAAVRHEGFSWFAEVSCGGARFTAALDRQFLADGTPENGTPVHLGFAPESLHVIPSED
jgi:molybdate/tungstate transport system ATP-binding protein